MVRAVGWRLRHPVRTGWQGALANRRAGSSTDELCLRRPRPSGPVHHDRVGGVERKRGRPQRLLGRPVLCAHRYGWAPHEPLRGVKGHRLPHSASYSALHRRWTKSRPTSPVIRRAPRFQVKYAQAPSRNTAMRLRKRARASRCRSRAPVSAAPCSVVPGDRPGQLQACGTATDGDHGQQGPPCGGIRPPKPPPMVTTCGIRSWSGAERAWVRISGRLAVPPRASGNRTQWLQALARRPQLVRSESESSAHARFVRD